MKVDWGKSGLDTQEQDTPGASMFPQQWGVHLHELAPTTVNSQHAPLGASPFSFSEMSGEQFEQLCWWLLNKDHDLVGCQVLGKQGKKSQDGIDLFAFHRSRPDALRVYECKCWKRFTPGVLKDTVDRFLSGRWASSTRAFTLVLSRSGVQGLSDEWIEARRKLANRGIEADLWTAEHLSERLQAAPDVISRFFGEMAAARWGADWMRRVAFHDSLLQALEDSRPHVSELARDFIGQDRGANEELVTYHANDQSWFMRRPWIEISALLPVGRKFQYPGSAIISLKLPDTAGVDVVLDQRWMLKNLLGHSGSPVSSDARPFVKGPLVGDKAGEIIELNHCRFIIPPEALKQIITASDALSDAYLNALQQQETEWGSIGFPVVNWNGPQVALCKVDRWAWDWILAFANHHDVREGSTQWHIFHEARDRLMPQCELGYRGIFWGVSIPELCGENEIAILWDPSFLDGRSDRRAAWACDESYTWIHNELLPAIGKWVCINRFTRSQRWLHPKATRDEMAQIEETWNSAWISKEVRSVHLMLGEAFRSLGLFQTLSRLQGFYNNAERCSRAHFSLDVCMGLYRTLLCLLEGDRGYAPYMAANLGLGGTCRDHAELKTRLVEQMKSGTIITGPTSVEYVMRTMLEAISEDDGWIDPRTRDAAFDSLMPWMAFHDRQLLIERHSRYI
ncbi:hypothetical protein OH720_20815 [Pseudomonas sp. WJP1]|uniref:hypothetical protein n=1 Tax=Pseudomonas sp. WJP1 TaxID=2986947 RepID=UPI00234B3E66|nr:hypothetical protein [Pseudomonas sp. WJP1]WCM49430.1 hypothetical protein OH720_20815 [Pseudomonas sp. WJP1]